MGMHLMAAWISDPGFWWNVIQVALGLGFVIFVHELGHFAVAKMCGVKCEKFYLGFDIGGWKLFKYQWGETEYGIGVLPLGGYVKMLGQDDNPARAAEELERSKVRSPEEAAEGVVAVGPDDEKIVLDPRSYMAQSVPERMAIISAGVIMNVIFAFLMAMAAYGMGVRYTPAVVGGVSPGSPAWAGDLRVGDEIVAIGEMENPRFEDIRVGVALNDIVHGVDLKVRRPGREELITINVKPVREGPRPVLGVLPASSTTLHPIRPVRPGAPAAGDFWPGDQIVAINGQSIGESDQALLQRLFAQHPDETLRLAVRYATVDVAEDDEKQSPYKPRQTTVEVAPVPMQTLGVSLRMGRIVAVQPGSPAAAAGVQAGDRIETIDGAPPVDAVFLPEWLRRKAGETIALSVSRGEQLVEIAEVTLRQPTTNETPIGDGQPMAAPALGIAYEVENVIVAVESAGPAAGKLQRQDAIVQAEFFKPPEDDQDLESAAKIEFDDKKLNWPWAMELLQSMPSGSMVVLTVRRGEEEVALSPIAPATAEDWFNADRGFLFVPVQAIRTAKSLPEAARYAGRETLGFLTQVYQFIHRIFTGQLSAKLAGGPVTIANAAYHYADAGFAELLIFLAMLSANLAVINFLPIPVLDGGHMVFLLYEGILRKPPSEKVQIALTYAGLAMILSLMIFVLALDVGLISRF